MHLQQGSPTAFKLSFTVRPFPLLNRLRIRAFHRNFTVSSGPVEASEATIPSFAKSLATFNHSAVPVSRRILLSGESERLHDSTLRTFLLTTLFAVLRVLQITQRGAFGRAEPWLPLVQGHV